MLTGTALKDRAKELNIEGRSKMNADELRAAIAEAETAEAEWNEILDETNTEVAATAEPHWRTVALTAGTYYRGGSPAKQRSNRGPTPSRGRSLTRAQRRTQ